MIEFFSAFWDKLTSGSPDHVLLVAVLGGLFIIYIVGRLSDSGFTITIGKFSLTIGGKGKGKPAGAPPSRDGYKPPCGGANAPKVATAKELADMEAQLTKKLEAHDKKNDKDFAALRSDFHKEAAELKQSIKELRKEMNDNHRAQTDRILQLLTAKK